MKKFKILYTLYYNSEMGGLHDNVFATVQEAKNRGHEVYVACREGIFQNKLKNCGINVININQDQKINSINKILDVIGSDIDLIHTHPGNSRIIALRLARTYDIPIIYHVHGAWTDNIKNYITEVSSVFAVSNSVKQKIIESCPEYDYKVHVIPNYSDYEVVNEPIKHKDLKSLNIALISRLEKDKSLIVEKIKNLKEFLVNTTYKITFNIIGEGSLKYDLIKFFSEHITNKNIEVNFIGWVSDKNVLKSYILKCDLVIGPGRVAIDALTLKRPVIVVGSQNYYGIINSENWQRFVSSNFGGLGPKPINEGDISNDLQILISDKNVYKESVEIGTKVIQNFFNRQDAIEKMFNIYDILLFKKSNQFHNCSF